MIARKDGVSYLVEVKTSKHKISPSKFWKNDKSQYERVELVLDKGIPLLKVAVQADIEVNIVYENPYLVD